MNNNASDSSNFSLSQNSTSYSVSSTDDSMVLMCQKDNSETVCFIGVAKGVAPVKRLLGNDKIYELLVRAINNRTRERNYFRLYSDLLSGTITEDEFDREIEQNEDDYVLASENDTDATMVKQALYLSKHIKDVQNTEDLASLFSFDPEKTERYVMQIE